jgi:copper chaperone CopZ
MLTFLLVLSLHPLLAQAGDSSRTTAFRVKGMTCALCSKAIDRALREVDGVQDVVIDVKTERVTVIAAPSIDPKTLEATLAAGGYQTERLPNP